MNWWMLSVAWAGGTSEWGTPALSVRSYKDLDLLIPGDAVAITAGDLHTCVITSCGAIECWGDDSLSQVSASPGGSGFEQISAGANHTCALTDNQRIVCWGDNSAGQATPPQTRYNRIAAGDDFTCGVKTNRQIECWGNVPVNVPQGTFGRIGAGGGQSCVYTRGGDTLTCFGDNSQGQASPPVQPQTLGLGMWLMRGGDEHSCAIAGGRLACFGRDSEGQVSGVGGNPSFPNLAWAVENPDYRGLWQFPGTQWQDVDGGEHHTCGINTDVGSDSVYCWGDDPYGETDAPSGDFNAVATGMYHSCAIANSGDVQCWGDNGWKQIDVPKLSPFCSVYKWGERWAFLVQGE